MLWSRSCFELISWMNKVKTIDREAVSWKFLFKIQKVNPLKKFRKHHLDRGAVHASEIDWTHGKIQHKIHLKSGHILGVWKSRKPESGKGTGIGTGTGSGTGIGTVMERGTYIKTGYRKNSWERCLENDKVVINSGFSTVNCSKW